MSSLTQQITPTVKLTIRKTPTDQDLNEVLFERDVNAIDGALSKTQFFLTNEQMLHFEDTIALYNEHFVDQYIQRVEPIEENI